MITTLTAVAAVGGGEGGETSVTIIESTEGVLVVIFTPQQPIGRIQGGSLGMVDAGGPVQIAGHAGSICR